VEKEVPMSAMPGPIRLGSPTRLVRRRPLGRRTRRLGIAAFFVSVAVNAGLGIYAVLAPGFGETQGKILGTSLCVTGAVLVAMACEPAWERKLLGPVPPVASALGAVAFTFTIVGMWVEPDSDVWAKTMITIFTLSVAGVAASLIVLARVAPRHLWLVKATFVLLAVGSGMYALLPWFGDDPGEWFVRSLAVTMIALAAFVVTVPVVHWLDRGALAAAEATGVVRFCPYCGRKLAGDVDVRLSCTQCGRGFTISSVAGHDNPSPNLT
jgi:hypothetical protein